MKFTPQGLTGLTLTRPVATWMLVVAVVVFGLVALSRLRLALLPDIAYPTITVRTEMPGSPPAEIESKLSMPVEDALGNLRRLERISSRSSSGSSDVILEFAWDADLDMALIEISERIDRLSLPREAERPIVLRYDPSQDPIMRIGLHGEGEEVGAITERRIAEEEIARKLAGIEGIAAVRVVGGREEEIVVAIDEVRLRQAEIDIQSISEQLSRENLNLASGILTDAGVDYVVRTLNEFVDLEEIGDLIVAERGSAQIRLHDIATVTRREREPEVLTRIGGRESVEIEIQKEADANSVQVAEAVRERLFGAWADQARAREAFAELEQARELQLEKLRAEKSKREPGATTQPANDTAKKESDGEKGDRRERGPGVPALPEKPLAVALPADITLAVLIDQSKFISQAIDEVEKSALIGAGLAIVVLLVFLRRPGPTLAVATAIPISVIATFVPMQLTGTSLNVMSLGGLALGIGMLVDNAIVVIESIYRCREEGDDNLRAAARGTREVSAAVVASTLTTVAVFFPIVFVEGIAGQVFHDQSLTVVFSLLASLVVALFFIPMLASRNRPRLPADADSRRTHAIDRLAERQRRAGGKMMPWHLLSGVWDSLCDGFGQAPRRLLRAALALISTVAVILMALVPPMWANAGAREWPGGVRVPILATQAAPGQVMWRYVVALPYRLVRGMIAALAAGTISVAGSLIEAVAHAAAGLALATVMLVGAIAWPALALLAGLLSWSQRLYPPLLAASLRHRAELIVVAALLLAGSLWMARGLGSELVPEVHQGELIMRLAAAPGTPIESTDALVSRVEAVLEETPGVGAWVTRVGVERAMNPASDEGSHSAEVLITLADDARSPESHSRVREALRRNIRVPGLESIEFRAPALFSINSPIEVEVSGHELPILTAMAEEIETLLAGATRADGKPLLGDVRSSQSRGSREIRLVYDRERLARFDLTTSEVAQSLRRKVAGESMTSFREQDRRIDIVTRVARQHVDSLGEVLDLVVAQRQGRAVTVRDLVSSVDETEGPAEIRRINHRRAAVVSANPTGLDLARTVAEIQAETASIDLPEGFRMTIGGQVREMDRSMASLLFALGLATFLVYVVMASLFEHLVQPLVIMVTLPLALVGVIGALALMGTNLSVLVFIGLIVLAGIVVNNAIVLLDYANQLRRDRGMPLQDAIKEAGRVRLRPILMTATTTIVALVPTALGIGEGAELRSPLAITVIGGLISSTLLTLLVIPVVYTVAEDAVSRLRGTSP